MPELDLKPFSQKKRRVYLMLFIFLFIVCLPFAILYATGYRFQSGFALVETGGVYVSVAPSGATLSLNGKDVGVSGFLNHSFYVDNLAPGTYAIHVARDGDYPWYKTLVVEPRIVTDAQAFLVPNEPVIRKIVISANSTSTATTTLALTRAQYLVYSDAFIPTTTKAILTEDGAPAPDDSQAGENLYLEDGAVRLMWSRSTSTIPSYMCTAPSLCEKSVIITHSKEKISRANFFAGGVVYQSKVGGIFLTETDIRPTPLTVPLYQHPGAEYRLIGGSLIVKDGVSLFEISGF